MRDVATDDDAKLVLADDLTLDLFVRCGITMHLSVSHVICKLKLNSINMQLDAYSIWSQCLG